MKKPFVHLLVINVFCTYYVYRCFFTGKNLTHKSITTRGPSVNNRSMINVIDINTYSQNCQNFIRPKRHSDGDPFESGPSNTEYYVFMVLLSTSSIIPLCYIKLGHGSLFLRPSHSIIIFYPLILLHIISPESNIA
jgi:hypothetical protein